METTHITAANSRKLEYRMLDTLEQLKLLRAIGPEQSRNQPYVQIVEAAACVRAIDTAPTFMPSSERQIDAMISRLGDDGVSAAVEETVRQLQAKVAENETGGEGEGRKIPDPTQQPA